MPVHAGTDERLTGAHGRAGSNRPFGLSVTELDVLRDAAEGLTIDETAERRRKSAQTVKSLVISLILTLRAPIGMAIAFLLAWFLVRVDMPGRKLIRYALWFAFFLPVLPMTFGWMMLIDEKHGLLNIALEKLPLINGPVFSVESIPGILWVHLTLTTVPIITILAASLRAR